MDLHLLDAFAARSVDLTLAEFHRGQRVPVARPRRAHHRRRRTAVMMGTTLGAAAPALAAVALVVVR